MGAGTIMEIRYKTHTEGTMVGFATRNGLFVILVFSVITTIILIARMHAPQFDLIDDASIIKLYVRGKGEQRQLRLSELVNMARAHNIVIKYPTTSVLSSNLIVLENDSPSLPDRILGKDSNANSVNIVENDRKVYSPPVVLDEHLPKSSMNIPQKERDVREPKVNNQENQKAKMTSLYQRLAINTNSYSFSDLEQLKEQHDLNVRTNHVTGSPLVENCQRHTNIVFLKTHKTGSDTTSQIFIRFADTKNLSIVLPTAAWSLGWPFAFEEKDYIHPPDNAKFNILCLHCVYNRSAFDKIMADGTKYVTILRDPWNQFKSSFSYFGWKRLVENAVGSTSHHLEKFLKNPGRYYDWENAKINKFVRNFMSFDLGLSPMYFDNVNAIMKFVGSIENDFDLVMILEYYDESLILLRRMLCWKLEDILYVPINVRKKITPVQSYAEQLYRHFSQADFTLYEHFKKIFLQRLGESHEIREEVGYFKKINLDFLLFCKQVVRDISLSFEVEKTKWNDAFKLDASYCTKSRFYIPDYVHELKQTRYGVRATEPHKNATYWPL
ncbi:uncharacterized protein LOC102803277 [Saccoglossus kowalevskii]|uniref:Uncharacterized protein LOC102803277 n=1 Tax=Saccoglossus kowalevskii TaxID=10224 RepID=A0ABM0MT98_SACKO|nr:PREDICTED: uncharacterized protein LOC102803277 [Saccoglossus kowalevskii]